VPRISLDRYFPINNTANKKADTCNSKDTRIVKHARKLGDGIRIKDLSKSELLRDEIHNGME